MGSLHPIGQPIIQSKKCGLAVRSLLEHRLPAWIVTWSGREKGQAAGGGPGVQPVAVRNDQSTVQLRIIIGMATCLPPWSGAARNIAPPASSRMSTRFMVRATVGVGHNEETAAPVRRAAFERAEHARLDPVAQAAKLAGDAGKSQADVPLDVFKEHPAGPAFADDPRDRGPQMAGVVLAAPLAGRRERLAGISRRQDIHNATPRSAVEGFNIVPDRRVT